MVPDPGSLKSYDRYAYSNNNPINYNDFTGHSAGWFGNFLYGFSAEFVRTNNWVGAITAPTVAQSLAPSSSESNAMLAGRIVADLATLAVGITEIIGGGTIAGGGAAVGCGTTLCLASGPAVAAGVSVSAYGISTTLSGGTALGENLGRMYANLNENNGESPYPSASEGSKGPYQSPYGYPSNPSKPPASGFEWRGKGLPGTNQGNWQNPVTGEWFHWDASHHGSPHFDYSNPFGSLFRIWPDGSMSPK